MWMYRIVYGSERDRSPKTITFRRLILAGILFFMFCVVVCMYFPEGRLLLQMLLIPGDPEKTLHAAEVFAAEMSSGYTISDAVRNFCSTVLENEYTS